MSAIFMFSESEADLTEEEKFVQLCVEEQYKDVQQSEQASKPKVITTVNLLILAAI